MDKREWEYFEQIETQSKELSDLIDIFRCYCEGKESLHLDERNELRLVVDNTNNQDKGT